MIKRTDVHRPSAINPVEYEYVACEYTKIEGLGDCYFLQEERRRIQEHMARTGGTYSHHQHGGNCMVCGSVNAIYTILFYHKPTNSYIRMGSDCAAKCEMAGYDGQFDAFKTACRNALELKAGKRKAEAVLAERGLSGAWVIYTSETIVQKFEELTIRDIVGKLVQYGSISENQGRFVRNLLDKIPHREEIERQREADKLAALPVPTGRMIIEGTVIKVGIYETIYGNFKKMTVKTKDGWICFGTVPSSHDCDRGNIIKFVATVEPSRNDVKFGFFKRPTKLEVLS